MVFILFSEKKLDFKTMYFIGNMLNDEIKKKTFADFFIISQH